VTGVPINGFGRIGRNFYRAYLKREPGTTNRVTPPVKVLHDAFTIERGS
jgi:glyceraldehyde-3-phosphate dehydrogenase/erythrose-4-phosphate dehydrogenase